MKYSYSAALYLLPRPRTLTFSSLAFAPHPTPIKNDNIILHLREHAVLPNIVEDFIRKCKIRERNSKVEEIECSMTPTCI